MPPPMTHFSIRSARLSAILLLSRTVISPMDSRVSMLLLFALICCSRNSVRVYCEICWTISVPAAIIWEPDLSEPQNFLLHFPMRERYRKPTIFCSRTPARHGSIRSSVVLPLPGNAGILCCRTVPLTSPMTDHRIWYPLTTTPTVLSATGSTPASADFRWWNRDTKPSVWHLRSENS